MTALENGLSKWKMPEGFVIPASKKQAKDLHGMANVGLVGIDAFLGYSQFGSVMYRNLAEAKLIMQIYMALAECNGCIVSELEKQGKFYIGDFAMHHLRSHNKRLDIAKDDLLTNPSNTGKAIDDVRDGIALLLATREEPKEKP